MESLLILIASLVVIGLITWRLLVGSTREKRTESKATGSFTPLEDRAVRPNKAGRDGDYRAVSLKICTKPCQAALEARNKPVLKADAPKLPLPGCDRACHCKFVNHHDRRVKTERRYPTEGYVKVSKEAALDEHREGKDRRARRFVYKGLS